MPKPPLPSGETILYFPRIWPLKSNCCRVYRDRRCRTRDHCGRMSDNAGVFPRFLVSDLDPSTGVAAADWQRGSSSDARSPPRPPVTSLRCSMDEDASSAPGSIESAAVRVESDPRARRSSRRRSVRVPVTLAQAVLKGASMDDVVRDAAMMGVCAIVPLVTAHTVARKATSPHGADRWRRIALASAKQCRRARIPEVGEPVAFDAWRKHAPED